MPGHTSGVRVANGSAHGVGVYTARMENPSLSLGFARDCRGYKKLLVCGVLDDAQAKEGRNLLGNLELKAESQDVRPVGIGLGTEGILFPRGTFVEIQREPNLAG